MVKKANKKIKNAEVCECDGIKFKSKLELKAYNVFKKYNIQAEYEPKSFKIIYGFKPKVPFYRVNKKGVLHNDNCKIRDAVYTPDFIYHHKDYTIIIELKGWANDSYAMRMKLLRKAIESSEGKYIIGEIRSEKQLVNFIEVVNQFF